MPFSDLDTSTVQPDRAAIFAAEFFVWWEQAGRVYYHYADDDGLKAFAQDAVKVLGGWQAARRVLRALDATTKILIEGKGVL
jgi:hypothetical protein